MLEILKGMIGEPAPAPLLKSLLESGIAIVSSIALSVALVTRSIFSLALTALKDKNNITIKARIEGNFILFVISPPFKFL